LIGPATFSAAEDFVVPLQRSERAPLVGEKTAGSTGNPLRVPLPGNGNFRVVTVRMTYSDGEEYVGHGIQPDVEVRMTPKDIYEQNDPVLEKGIATIKSWITPKD
jgi:carboxyl-terminal processing protease